MASLDLTSFDAMLKELYPGDTPMNVAMKRRPLLSMMAKRGGMVGDNLVVPLTHEFQPGRSATFTKAQDNAGPSVHKKFNVTRVRNYGLVTIDSETILASGSNKGAFVEARKNEIDNMLRNIGKSAAIQLYRTSGGSVGRIATSGISGATATLTNPSDVQNFGVGFKYDMDTVDGGGTIHAGGPLTVLSRDEGAGTVTFTAGIVATIGAAADADFFFQEGDYDGAFSGLAGWIPDPTAAVSATLFFGVDRSLDPFRLAGVRINTPANSVEENLLSLSERIVQNGGDPDKAFISHGNYSDLVKGLGSKREYANSDDPANAGFEGVKIHTSGGSLMVHPDPDCPDDRGYCLEMKTWKLWHLGGFPHLVTDDGNSSLRQAAADGIEVRARYFAQPVCNAPGYNGVCAL